jgi:hypothetical protein
MDKELRDIQRQMKGQQLGRMWRPSRELRNAILAWAANAQTRGQTWREISAAVLVDKDKIKAWRNSALAGQMKNGSVGVVPVQITNTGGGSAAMTAVVLRGASVEDIAALLAGL